VAQRDEGAVPAEVAAALVRERGLVAAVDSVTALGAGTDHHAFLVNRTLVVRVSAEADADARRAATEREAALLERVAARVTPPVPQPVLVEPEHGLLAYVRLPGRPWLDGPVADPARVAAALGTFAAELHAVPAADVAGLVEPDDEPLQVWLDDARASFEAVATTLPGPTRSRIEPFLAAVPPPEPVVAVLCHNDLGVEHVLVDDEGSELAGIIDWSDAALADPAHDLARLWRDLGPDLFAVVLRHDGRAWRDDDLARMRFYARCALLEDLAYAAESGDRRYRDAALAHVDHAFAG